MDCLAITHVLRCTGVDGQLTSQPPHASPPAHSGAVSRPIDRGDNQRLRLASATRARPGRPGAPADKRALAGIRMDSMQGGSMPRVSGPSRSDTRHGGSESFAQGGSRTASSPTLPPPGASAQSPPISKSHISSPGRVPRCAIHGAPRPAQQRHWAKTPLDLAKTTPHTHTHNESRASPMPVEIRTSGASCATSR